ncbi:biotin--[acetyl-CoA-carboxylase] ligase [Jeotgalibacillus campisalis]|uniref:Bifunctional ligase/repressor BirA n=1 Tax=Jeotgalibacillus campisalis TaxID=220754 RepID=A0A0C2VVP3_9BACL|nr:biotin--[acetyl-CoA-carboxylase] ligase [Jeotgalibacillus campisalis]KIL48038.1 biotin--acetyl-CoA-carboxylase ligase [Jeotgalibacillus campisalis]
MASKIRESLLVSLSAHQDEYLSGEQLAKEAGCSRTAIWKHIEELRKEGITIDSKRKKGYKLMQLSQQDNITETDILLGLQTTSLGRSIHHYDAVESTQKIAHKLAQEHAPEGTLVIAEEQTAGRGRMARSWHSPKGSGIWMSLLLRPELPPQKAPQFTLLTAVALVQAIEDICDVQVEIKWPNDLLINNRKVTGILTELQADSEQIHSLIIGIGMNVNQKQEDFPKELVDIATSLAIEKGSEVSRAAIVQRTMYHLEKYYHLYMEKGFAPIKLLWESYAISIGRHITARTFNGSISGIASGITEEGVLLLEDDQGAVHSIYSADIEINPKNREKE